MLKENINDLIAAAMKAREGNKVKVLRLIKSEFLKFLTTGSHKELTDAEEVKILKKLQKQWKEEIDAFNKAGREMPDLTLELEYLESFMPKEMSEGVQMEKANNIIEAYLKGLPIEERASMKYLGAVIKIINQEYPMIENKLISDLYKKATGNDK